VASGPRGGESYTGLAINQAQSMLYAANGRGAGGIDVFDGSFSSVKLGPEAFVDPSLPKGFVPFTVAASSTEYQRQKPAGGTVRIDWNRTLEKPIRRIECVNLVVGRAEIADQKVVAENAEPGRRKGDAPGRREISAAYQSLFRASALQP
jgi:hypothetical protein